MARMGTEDTETPGGRGPRRKQTDESSPMTLPRQMSAAGEAHALRGCGLPAAHSAPVSCLRSPPPAGRG